MSDTVEIIHTDAVPAPAGHYSQATAWAGPGLRLRAARASPGWDADCRSGRFDVQVRRALANMLAILAEAGCAPRNILRVTAYIVDVENWPSFDRIYSEALGEARPARTIVPVPNLHHGYLVEIEAIAARHP